jgi:hypothetical protein
MNFKDKFKLGDIICSDHFRNGLCMVVERLNPKDIWEDSFTCQDLVTDHQKWRAYEFDTMFDQPNNWRIATDTDIVNYLSRFVDIPLGKVGKYYVAKLTDDGIKLESHLFSQETIYLEGKVLVDLKRIIDERIVG